MTNNREGTAPIGSDDAWEIADNPNDYSLRFECDNCGLEFLDRAAQVYRHGDRIQIVGECGQCGQKLVKERADTDAAGADDASLEDFK